MSSLEQSQQRNIGALSYFVQVATFPQNSLYERTGFLFNKESYTGVFFIDRAKYDIDLHNAMDIIP